MFYSKLYKRFRPTDVMAPFICMTANSNVKIRIRAVRPIHILIAYDSTDILHYSFEFFAISGSEINLFVLFF